MSKHEFGETPAQRKWQADHDRQQEEFAREKCDWLECWRGCRARRCRRHKACRGDPQTCWDTNWAALPEDFKDHLRRAIKLMAGGMLAQDAAQAAETAIAEHREEIARAAMGRSDAAPALAAVPESPAHDPAAPRLRRL